MTKLLEWLLVATAIFGVWFAILIGNSTLGGEWQKLILLLPIIFIFSFGSYAATIVLYRVFTFNTCKNAAVELQQQIVEAKKDLRNRGIILTKEGGIFSNS